MTQNSGNTLLSVNPHLTRWIRTEVLPSFIRSHLLTALKTVTGVRPAPSSYNPAGRYVRWYVMPVYTLGGQCLRVARSKARSFQLLTSGSCNRERHMNYGNCLSWVLGYRNPIGLPLQTIGRIWGGFRRLPRIRSLLYALPLLLCQGCVLTPDEIANDLAASGRGVASAYSPAPGYYQQQQLQQQQQNFERQQQQMLIMQMQQIQRTQ